MQTMIAQPAMAGSVQGMQSAKRVRAGGAMSRDSRTLRRRQCQEERKGGSGWIRGKDKEIPVMLTRRIRGLLQGLVL